MKAIQMSGPGVSEVLEYNNVQDPALLLYLFAIPVILLEKFSFA